jgi:aspartate ammonia-lyase
MAERKEHDALGTVEVDAAVLWGMHTERALKNFAYSTRRVPYALIAALATVKRAVAMTNAELGYLKPDIAEAIISACDQIRDNKTEMARHFPLDALQGGAGTSTNMNVNEVIANLALAKLGRPYGDNEVVHPLNHVNLHGSTNDLYPTALRIAAIEGVRRLSAAMAKLQGAFQIKEAAFASMIKMGRTEMQPAVPMTLGQEFSAFAEAVARDRWRTFKCEERLRLVNLGGTAIGTGITAPRDYIFRVIEVLRALTGMGLSRNENMIDATANADAFVEVSGILKAAATTMHKIAGDLRLLHFLGEIALPPLQAGSSIMPGKVNPVMMEGVMQVSMAVRANDLIVGDCAAHGTLQINEFMPLIAWALLDSIDMLTASADALADHVVGIEANAEVCAAFVDDNPALITAFVPHLGYDKANELRRDYADAKRQDKNLSVRKYLSDKLGDALVDDILAPQNLVKFGSKNAETKSL